MGEDKGSDTDGKKDNGDKSCDLGKKGHNANDDDGVEEI